jgi:hypothetical protein
LLSATQVRRNNFVVQHSIFFALLTMTFGSTIKSERIVVVPLQQSLGELAAVLIHNFLAYLISTDSLCKVCHQT